MTKPCKWIVVLIYVFSLSPCSAQIYKWVDENGVVHYTEEPPENQQMTEVKISEPPTAEQRAEAELIYRQSDVQSETTEIEAARGSQERRPLAMTADTARCFEAYSAIQVLERRGDVFEDEAGKIHHWDSLHSFWYESYRKRLSDSEKRDRVNQLEDDLDQYCDIPMKEVRKRAGAWEKEQSASQCTMARQKLDRIRGDNGKTPRGTIEDIENLISRYCQ